jgi:hypothetical protein
MWQVRARTSALVAALTALCIALPVMAAESPERIDGPAAALAAAEPISPLATDIVSIFNTGELRQDVVNRALASARSTGGTAAIGRSASVAMTALRRGNAYVQVPPSGFSLPMGTTVLPPDFVGRTMGRDVAGALAPDAVVMGKLTAGLRGAQAGDTVELVAAWGSRLRFRVAAVVDDSVLGGTELLMSPDAADRLGIQRLGRIVLWGFSSRSEIDAAMVANGLVSTTIRIRRSWSPADPDDTLGMAATKAKLGEFAYRVNSDGSVSQSTDWVAANLPPGRELFSSIAIRARCHLKVRGDLQAAFTEIAMSGLGFTIDVGNANTYGGCHNARFNRLTPNSSLGFLSRHSWAMAFDTNTVTNCQGCAPPKMDCRTVRIFRKHGFAWGGNFLTPDGMHFEWVGERRDQRYYPWSRFCPNTVGPTTSALSVEETERATLFADDGLYAGDH